MWYTPYLRVRRAVLMYVYIATGISLAAIALHFWPGAIHGAHSFPINNLDVSFLFVPATAFVGGFATVLGLNLAAENDGHLEVAWTKPISREGYALGVFAVDIGAMAVCVVFTVLCSAIVLDIFAGHQVVEVSAGSDWLKTCASLGLPLLVYAWIAALSASIKRSRGIVAGLFWPIVTVLGILPVIPVPAIHAVASAINLFNPLQIYTTNSHDPQPSLWTLAWGWAVAAVLLSAALVQWRRLEL